MKDKVLATSQIKTHFLLGISWREPRAAQKALFHSICRRHSWLIATGNGNKGILTLWQMLWDTVYLIGPYGFFHEKKDDLWDEIQINSFENFPSTRNFPLFSLTACWVSENLVYSMESEWEPTRSSAVWATLVLSSSLPGLKHICSANGYFNLTYSYVVKTILWAL